MTTWSYNSKTRVETALADELDFDILLESGDLLLVEDIRTIWGETNKASTSWSQLTKNNTSWTSPAKS